MSMKKKSAENIYKIYESNDHGIICYNIIADGQQMVRYIKTVYLRSIRKFAYRSRISYKCQQGASTVENLKIYFENWSQVGNLPVLFNLFDWVI